MAAGEAELEQRVDPVGPAGLPGGPEQLDECGRLAVVGSRAPVPCRGCRPRRADGRAPPRGRSRERRLGPRPRARRRPVRAPSPGRRRARRAGRRHRSPHAEPSREPTRDRRMRRHARCPPPRRPSTRGVSAGRALAGRRRRPTRSLVVRAAGGASRSRPTVADASAPDESLWPQPPERASPEPADPVADASAPADALSSERPNPLGRPMPVGAGRVARPQPTSRSSRSDSSRSPRRGAVPARSRPSRRPTPSRSPSRSRPTRRALRRCALLPPPAGRAVGRLRRLRPPTTRPQTGRRGRRGRSPRSSGDAPRRESFRPIVCLRPSGLTPPVTVCGTHGLRSTERRRLQPPEPPRQTAALAERTARRRTQTATQPIRAPAVDCKLWIPFPLLALPG